MTGCVSRQLTLKTEDIKVQMWTELSHGRGGELTQRLKRLNRDARRRGLRIPFQELVPPEYL